MPSSSRLGAPAYFVSFLTAYALIVSLFVPAAIRPARASSASARAKPNVSVPTANSGAQEGGRRERELLVRFRAGVSEQDKSATIASHGSRRKKRLRGDSEIEKLELPAGQDPEVAAQQLRLNPAVEFVEPNFLIRPDDLRLDAGNARRLTPQPFQPSVSDSLNPFPTGSSFGDSNSKAGFSASNSLMASLALQPQGPQVDDPRSGEQWALSNTGQSGGQFGSDIRVATACKQRPVRS